MGKKTKTHPMIISIPAGTTKIDLRPVILPIIQSILHAKDRYNYQAVQVSQAEEWLDRAFFDSSWWRRVERLKVMWFKPYMEANGWKRNNVWDKEKLSYEKPKKKPDPRDSHWEQSHHIDLREDKTEPFLSNIRIIETLRASEGLHDPNDVIDAVLEYVEPLDRLALEGGEDV